MQKDILDIILPCFNPPEGWVDKIILSFRRIEAALPGIGLRLILVNDGSTQGLDEKDIARLRSEIPSLQYISSSPNKGKGFALRKGVEAANSKFQIYTDVDFPYEEESLLALFDRLQKEEGDIVAGVRDASYYEGVPVGRKRISKLLRWMLRTFLRLKLTDTQCGLKGFNAKGRALFLSTTIDRFLFDLEFIFLASNDSSIRLIPSPVRLKPHIIFSKVNWRILLNESFNFMRIFFRGIWKRLFA